MRYSLNPRLFAWAAAAKSAGSFFRRTLTRMNRLIDRFLPHRLRRPIWKKPWGANSIRSTAWAALRIGFTTQPLGDLEATAVPQCRGGCLLHDDHDVSAIATTVAKLADIDPAK